MSNTKPLSKCSQQTFWQQLWSARRQFSISGGSKFSCRAFMAHWLRKRNTKPILIKNYRFLLFVNQLVKAITSGFVDSVSLQKQCMIGWFLLNRFLRSKLGCFFSFWMMAYGLPRYKWISWSHFGTPARCTSFFPSLTNLTTAHSPFNKFRAKSLRSVICYLVLLSQQHWGPPTSLPRTTEVYLAR